MQFPKVVHWSAIAVHVRPEEGATNTYMLTSQAHFLLLVQDQILCRIRTYRKCILLELHLVNNASDTFNIDFDLIPVLQETLWLHEEPDTARCPCQDCCASSQCGSS
jgi:hypothetical protein